MPVLKNLTFTTVPARGHDPPDQARRATRGAEASAGEPSYVRVVERRTGKGDERRQVERQQRVKTWARRRS